MQRQSHILNASSNLLGVALLIIAGLNISHFALRTFADEIAWAAAVALMASCLLAYLAIRATSAPRLERWADRAFIAGMLALFVSVIVLASTSY